MTAGIVIVSGPSAPTQLPPTNPQNAQIILGWAYNESFAMTSITRNANEAVTSATVKWPDGSNGVFTADTLSSAFPGAIDAWHVTYVNGMFTATVTQSLVTRDAAGAVINQPVLTIA